MEWASIAAELASLISSEPDETANMANTSALLFERLNAHLGSGVVNWCGFYRLVNEDTLVLGPFQVPRFETSRAHLLFLTLGFWGH